MLVTDRSTIELQDVGRKAAAGFLKQGSADVYRETLCVLGSFNFKNCDPQKTHEELLAITAECVEYAQKRHGGEDAVVASVLSRLACHFHIEEQVWGTHWSGSRLRIDAILIPKDDSAWKTKRPRLGVEFKNSRLLNSDFGLKEFSKWIGQCRDYSRTKFDDHGFVYVFACDLLPRLASGFSRLPDSHATECVAWRLYARDLWREGIGSLSRDLAGFSFVANGDHEIWSEAKGVRVGARMSMERKFGSR